MKREKMAQARSSCAAFTYAYLIFPTLNRTLSTHIYRVTHKGRDFNNDLKVSNSDVIMFKLGSKIKSFIYVQ